MLWSVGTPVCFPWLSSDNRIGGKKSNVGRAVDSEGPRLLLHLAKPTSTLVSGVGSYSVLG